MVFPYDEKPQLRKSFPRITKRNVLGSSALSLRKAMEKIWIWTKKHWKRRPNTTYLWRRVKFHNIREGSKECVNLNHGPRKRQVQCHACLSRRRIEASTVCRLQMKDTNKEDVVSDRGSSQEPGEGLGGPRTGAGLAEHRLEKSWWCD